VSAGAGSDRPDGTTPSPGRLLHCRPDTIELREDQGHVRVDMLFAVELDPGGLGPGLPDRVERLVEDAGQRFKRGLFAALLEHCDRQLVHDMRCGDKPTRFACRGLCGTTYKSSFGSVRVQRQRIFDHDRDAYRIPFAERYGDVQAKASTLTGGLAAAICEAVSQQPVEPARARLEQVAGDRDLLSHGTVVNVVHSEGQALALACRHRAAEVLEAHPQLARNLYPALAVQDDPHSAPSDGDSPSTEPDPENDSDEPWLPLGVPGSVRLAAAVDRDRPRRVDPHTAIVEVDEVKVKAQATTSRKSLLEYTAMVMWADQQRCLCAASATELLLQVAAVLILLGVGHPGVGLLVLADGASWIRTWFEALGMDQRCMILCWYHVVKRCYQQLSLACRGRRHREAVQKEALAHLWEGRVDDALAALQAQRGAVKNEAALDQLIGYLEKRRPYLPDYKSRYEAGLWIASNRVEKLNDWVVSDRCKHRGMSWVELGVDALASFEVARRNREWRYWVQNRSLPPWRPAPISGEPAA